VHARCHGASDKHLNACQSYVIIDALIILPGQHKGALE